MTATFFEGDARVVLRDFPPDFFHCAVTSPPYFGLRSYDGGVEVWDGEMDCDHEWGVVAPPRRLRKATDIVDLNSKEATNRGNLGVELKATSFCSKCGAWRGQLGAEPTPELYIQHLIQVMREVRRVLRPDGVFWLNIGDSWSGSGGAHKPEHANPGLSKSASREGVPRSGVNYNGCKPLDMVLIPEQLALAARADGWYVRSVLIWAKGVSLSDKYNGNPMPESVNGWRWEKHKVKVGDAGRGKEAWRQGANRTPQQDHAPDGSFKSSAIWQDCPGCPKCESTGGYVLRKGSWRPTDAYEHILMLAKTNSYFCDREAVLEAYDGPINRWGGNTLKRDTEKTAEYKDMLKISQTSAFRVGMNMRPNLNGRNLRSVLAIPTAGSKIKHFATFPPRLVEPLIKAATSEKGCCPVCGSPWARVVERGSADHVGWLPTCSCGWEHDPSPCWVLDPFCGSGTVSLVCERLGLDSVGIDTSAKYIQFSEDRVAEDKAKRGRR